MREMKNSGIKWIGEIPVDWSIFPVKRIFKNQKRIVGSDVDKYERLALTMNGVIKRSKNDSEGLQPEKFESYQILKENEIVFKLIDLENVKTSRVGLSPYTGLVSPAYIIITNEKEDNRFFYYWFMFMYYNEVFNHLGGEGVRSALNAKDVLSLPVPDISEELMNNIAFYLDEKCTKIDTIIEKQQKIIEKLKAYKLSLITETVTKGLNPDVKMKDSGVKWIGEIPEDYNLIKLKYLVSFIESGVSVNAGQNEADVNELGVLKTSSVSKFVFDIHENKSVNKNEENRVSCPVCSNTLIVSRMNTPELVGACGYVDKSYSNIFLPDRLWQVHFKTHTNVKYIWYYLRSKCVRFYISSLSTGTSSSMQNISQSQLGDINIVLPTSNQQSKIADYLDKKCSAIDSVIEKKQALIEKLTEYKKSLIYEVVTGKKEVCSTKKAVTVICPVGIPTNEEEYAKILLIQKIITRCGGDLKGRIHLMKILHALEVEIGFSFHSEYTRYTHGPYDKKIEKYESELVRKGWISLKKGKKVEYIVVNSTAYKTDYNRIFAKYNKEIERIIDFFKSMKRASKAEKVATLLASWNDFLIDGIVEPTDNMIITDVMTNWTENKGNIDYSTWQTILSQMKTANIVPHGYGRHTIRMED